MLNSMNICSDDDDDDDDSMMTVLSTILVLSDYKALVPRRCTVNVSSILVC